MLNCSLYGQSDGSELGTVDFFCSEFSVLCDDALVLLLVFSMLGVVWVCSRDAFSRQCLVL